ncbi:MAG: HEAT repeat domain-containing protein [Candidatus Marinimicrobia bacterium]|nr:HEAT repeat domain-containing protein [Candidatus Neomarinimicrobiota bacterium]
MADDRGSNTLSENVATTDDKLVSWSDFAKLFITPFFIAAAAIGLFFSFTFFFSESKGRFDYLESIKVGGANNRWHSAFMLSKILRADAGGPVDDRFMNEILSIYKNAKSDDPRVRRYLTLALGHISDPRSVKSLKDATLDADDETRLYALWSLGKLGTEGVHKDLEKFLTDPDPAMRKLSAHLLGSVKGGNPEIALRVALSDPVDDVKWNAALSLAKWGDKAGLEVLEMMLDREYLHRHDQMDESLKEMTIKSAIIAIGNLHEVVLREKIEALRDSDPSMKVRQAAIDALIMFEEKS